MAVVYRIYGTSIFVHGQCPTPRVSCALQADRSLQKTKAQLSNVLEAGEKVPEWTDIRFDDTQDIQVLQDRFLQTHYHLTTNRIVMQELTLAFSSFTPAQRDDDQVQQNQRSLSSLIGEAEMQALRVTSISERVKATLALVRIWEHIK